MAEQLIQTEQYAFVYGDFKGKPNQRLFQCPRGLEDKDLYRYINEHRSLVCPMGIKIPFVDDDTDDLRKVEGKDMIAYWRMYWRNGYWDGRWMGEKGNPTKIECAGVNKILDWIFKEFPNGCDWYMQDFFKSNFKGYCGDKRFCIKPFMSEWYKILVDTTYGNGDYPVRIYVYRNKEE